MGRGTFFYALWCLAVIAGFLAAGIFGYSPFAEGGRAHGGARAGIYGPTHK
ncbi:hypothetical protein ACFQ1E_19610 [Sphingomonas canadensis]|uniref:Uncharacterized protein n=1 Tax=Sphingomonas canadensis TaxID=1219257 RepID=A0ABW3HDP1_9SPHN|nr:hypothetical protein [Sphingomonas canadensis]MCW3838256.1 hypothetical protein [Sphingomonas canadensis]